MGTSKQILRDTTQGFQKSYSLFECTHQKWKITLREKYRERTEHGKKRLVINRDQFISEPADFILTETDFELGQDSTVPVPERTRGSKMEGAYQKRKGNLLEQTDHTIYVLPAGKTTPTILSKRDIGQSEDENQPCRSKEADRRVLASRKKKYNEKEQQHSSEDRNDTYESVQEIGSFPPEQPITIERERR